MLIRYFVGPRTRSQVAGFEVYRPYSRHWKTQLIAIREAAVQQREQPFMATGKKNRPDYTP